MDSDDLRDAIYLQLSTLRSGTLSFWGDWFGRPYDNVHRIVGADAVEGAAVIYFDHAESLIVDTPRRWSLDGGQLVIRDAERVRFRWFYYGQLPSPEALRTVDYCWNNGIPSFATDFQPKPVPRTHGRAAAVQLHTIG